MEKRVIELQRGVRGEADHRVGAQYVAAVVHTDVVLTDVHTIGAGFQGQFRRVIHDEGHTEISANRSHESCAR
jgi:hypothetical protein